MTDYIEEYLANSLYHSHIMEETNISLFSLVTEDGVPIRKLFISNLAERTSFKDLIKLFSKYGNVESCFLRRNQGNSNYAFITFNSVEAAASARYDEGIRLHNRDLRVLAADSWHQPDSIENQCYNIKDKSKSNKLSNDIVYNFDYIQDDITDTNIQTLNDDCLIHIFLQLPIIDRIRIERVCKRWKALSQESWSSVKRLDLSMWGLSGLNRREISTCTIRKVLLRCGSYLNEINLSIVPYPLRQSTATIVAKLCPNLQRIDITGIVVSASGINSLINNCHDITKFSLGSTTYICDIDLQKLFKVNPKLRYFKAYSSKISGRCLLYLPLETMEEIVLEYCTCLQEHLLAQAFAKLQNLKSLTMNRCIDISGNVIQAIGTNCTNLKTLEVSCISFLLQSNDMLHIAQLTNLEVLKISMNALVTDEFFSNLASKCLRLKYLDIAECLLVTDISIAAVAALPKLEVLIINYLGLVTDINLQDTCNLKQLECRACKFTDKTMINFLEYAPQLELLDLSGCRDITNETLKEAATVTVNRTNNTILKIFVGGTSVDLSTFDKVSPFLQIVNIDLSNREL
ncbi:SCF E3 ubiquitin ligase complex F-box protein pof2 [Bombus terrestris]|uniref:SCF E3 ubiquitin ligase complex F-box protein pof2 n=1 Tax=Bombus terrestris TaxID=30195 RepID=A0A9B2JRL9_BOMTE|nr:SCF E3 ubiquitin ligase complex F-box protein pof2 [Bombus terrestris]